jgi:hypothetical protein
MHTPRLLVPAKPRTAAVAEHKGGELLDGRTIWMGLTRAIGRPRRRSAVVGRKIDHRWDDCSTYELLGSAIGARRPIRRADGARENYSCDLVAVRDEFANFKSSR